MTNKTKRDYQKCMYDLALNFYLCSKRTTKYIAFQRAVETIYKLHFRSFHFFGKRQRTATTQKYFFLCTNALTSRPHFVVEQKQNNTAVIYKLNQQHCPKSVYRTKFISVPKACLYFRDDFFYRYQTDWIIFIFTNIFMGHF